MNLSNRYLQLGIFSSLLLAGLFISDSKVNGSERSSIKLALQETIPRQHNDAQERQQQWERRQENIEQQRKQRQRSQFQENQQKTQTFQRQLETNQEQYQRSQQRQDDLRQRVQQQQQRYQDRFKQRRLLIPSANHYRE